MATATRLIKKLDESVINRIAAGEVIQGPSNAIKELLENCLDAGSTTIQVVVKQGGLKMLQITDNGHGIQKCDMDIVCERFTTSKLSTFEDLSTIETYGFRGEALSSISHVAHLSMVSKTNDSQCAFRGCYSDGKLKGSLKPCAATQGTQITVEDLFYNIPTRRKALRNGNEEFNKVYDVISKYSIHNPKIGFSLKKHGENKLFIKTQVDSTNVDNIRAIYGLDISRELLEVMDNNDTYKYKLYGYVTNANYNAKKAIFLLFINNRLVESTALKKSLEAIYSNYLPKGTHPFMYISLEIASENVDVNVHPTKHEVHFLYESDIITCVQKSVENILLSSNTSRTYLTQALLPSSFGENNENEIAKPPQYEKISASQLVRTDSKDRTLNSFIMSTSMNEEDVDDEKEEATYVPSQSFYDSTITANGTPRSRSVFLNSILSLRSNVENELNNDLRDIFKRYVFVGCVDKRYSLIQHNTELYLVDVHKISCELFYQILLYDFANYGSMSLSEKANIRELCLIALDLQESEIDFSTKNITKEDLAKKATKIITEHDDLLVDYFSLEIENEHILSLPYLLESYIPNLDGLPNYILNLSAEVTWTSEKECFESFCRETSYFYSFGNGYEGDSKSDWKWTVENVLFPAFRKILIPTNNLVKHIVKLASVPELYKVFERC